MTLFRVHQCSVFNFHVDKLRGLTCSAALLAALLVAQSVFAAPPLASDWRHTEVYSQSEPASTEYLLGLGALQKIRSRWQFKDSELVQGELEQITWQVQGGFTAEDAFDWYSRQLPADATLLFECEGRACGSSAQWASRVFDERVLYGHDDRQHYAAWRMRENDQLWTLVLYASDRANRRHFLRLDRIRHLSDESGADESP